MLLNRILDSHRLESGPGAYTWYRPDLVLLPDYAVALLAEDLRRAGQCPFPSERLLVVADHFAPPATIERAALLRTVQGLCAQFGWPLRLFEGICHQLLIEDARVQPGSLVIGSDSHTVTAGALGCLAIGFGSTDVLGALMRGRIALRRPEIIEVVLKGALPPWVMGKDVALDLLRRFGPRRLDYAALEIHDASAMRLGQSERFAICNQLVEAGAKAALFVPDEVTWQYIQDRDGTVGCCDGGLPDGAGGEPAASERHEIDLSELEPLVALPHSPFAVRPVREVQGLALDQVFIGSCSASRFEDLAVAAAILDGHCVASGLRAIVIPGSRRVLLRALDAGLVKTLVAAGVAVNQPSCGPCGAIDKGVLAPGERCAATINRNWRGRMGASEAEIILVSPAVAAASMITGTLTDPRRL